MQNLSIGRLQAKMSFAEILGHSLLWIIIIVATLGIGLVFYPYSFARFVIDRCFIVDVEGNAWRMECDLGAGKQVWHIILWTLLVLLTIGLAYPFYLYTVWRMAVEQTRFYPHTKRLTGAELS